MKYFPDYVFRQIYTIPAIPRHDYKKYLEISRNKG
jgi:hypothetical protein